MPTDTEIQAAARALADKVTPEIMAGPSPHARLSAVLGFQEAARVVLEAAEVARDLTTSKTPPSK